MIKRNALALLLTLTAAAHAAAPSDADLEKALIGAKILAAGYPVRVRVTQGLAYVTTYQHRSTSNADHDCKIDAVLIARFLLQKCGEELGRVKVHFYNQPATEYKEVNVSAGDVAAYAAQKLSMDQLLASVELSTHKNQSANASTAGSVAGLPRTFQPTSGFSDLAQYKVPGGFSFSYPRSWHVKAFPESNAIVSVSGAAGGGHPCEIKLTHHEVEPGTSLDYFIGMVDEHVWKPHDHRKVSENHEVFGAGHAFTGVRQLFHMNVSPERLPIQMMTFIRGNQAYTFSCVTPGWQQSEAKQWFDLFLANVKLD